MKKNMSNVSASDDLIMKTLARVREEEAKKQATVSPLKPKKARKIPIAMVSGIAEFIPVLGPTVASAFGTLLTATVEPFIALQTAGFYLLLTQINHNLVYPTLIGKSLNLPPIAIILRRR